MLRVRVRPRVADRRRLIEGGDQRREQRHEHVEDNDDDANLRGDGDFVAQDAHDVPSGGDAIELPQRGWRSRGLDRMARMSAVMFKRINVAAKINPQA